MSRLYLIEREATMLQIGDWIMEERADGNGHDHVATFLAYGHDDYMVFAVEVDVWMGHPKGEGNVYVSKQLWGKAAGFPATLLVGVIA